jgi:hypothetical protein
MLAERTPAYTGIMQARVTEQIRDEEENGPAIEDSEDNEFYDEPEVDEFLASIPMEPL